MKNFLIVFIISMLALFSCGTKKEATEMTYGMPVSTTQIEKYSIKAVRHVTSRPGFNKICKDEGISSDLKRWSKASFKSWEDQKMVDQYYYIKDTDHPEEIYRLDLEIVGRDTTFVIETRKRIKR